jgi:hypothetical protein
LKRISIIVLAGLMLALIVADATVAVAQTRRRAATRKGRPASTRNQSAGGATTKTTNSTTTARTAGTRVAEQIKSLGKFLYLYGPISKELATSEAAARSGGQSSSNATDAIVRNRAKLREVFQGYRTQMDELETLFSGSSELRVYYTRLLGVAASAAQAEERVASGRYDEAGRSLLDVMNRLTDVLLDMQGS